MPAWALKKLHEFCAFRGLTPSASTYWPPAVTPLRLRRLLLASFERGGDREEAPSQLMHWRKGALGGSRKERTARQPGGMYLRRPLAQRLMTTSRTTLPLGPKGFCGLPFNSARTPPALPSVTVNWSCAFHWAFSPGRSNASWWLPEST